MKAVVLVSGGMDSVTLLALAASTYAEVEAVSVNYGQRHVRELAEAKWQANHWRAQFTAVDLPLGAFVNRSALTGDVEVPHGHYSEESMRQTVVPGRNAVLLSLAFAIGASSDAVAVGTAVHAGDHFIYPDCRPEFIERMNSALRFGTVGHRLPLLNLWTPFLTVTKVEILRLGMKLKVDYRHTWTCYEGNAVSCGKCGACQERLEAFNANNAVDPLAYAR